MTKEEAIKEMRNGRKITHHYFSNDEWMTMKGDKIILEDGVSCYPEEFWKYRINKQWDDGYELLPD